MRRTRVLVFGVDRDARMDARRDLLASDFPVRMASSMAEAAKAVAAGGIDLIVLITPDTVGDGLVHQVRSAFTIPTLQFEPGGVHSVTDLVRTVAGAQKPSRDQEGASE